jgi:hypothetical protein
MTPREIRMSFFRLVANKHPGRTINEDTIAALPVEEVRECLDTASYKLNDTRLVPFREFRRSLSDIYRLAGGKVLPCGRVEFQ